MYSQPVPERVVASALHALAPVTLGSWDGTPGPASYAPADPNGDIGMTQCGGQRGLAAKLRFEIYDGQGVAHALAGVKRNGQQAGVADTGFGPVAYGSVYCVGWNVPGHAPKGNYSFCVVGVDKAGNKSPQSCAPLALK